LALDDPVAISLLVVLIAYQFYRGGKGMKRSRLQSLGLVVVALGLFVLIFFDFLTAFVFFSAGILIYMTGELILKMTTLRQK
jgi:hypothetical protein